MSFNSLLNQDITLYTKSGYNRYGRETVGSGVTHCVRVERTSKARLLPNGEQVMINAICYMKPNVTINEDDKVTYDGTNYKVFGVYTAVEGEGNTHHKKVELIKWQTT